MSDSGSINVTPRERTKISRFFNFLRENWFMLTTILGVILGFGVGFYVQTCAPKKTTIMLLELPGTLFIRVLQLTILPMIAASLINVLASLDPGKNGKVGKVALSYCMFFNLFSSLIGLALAFVINPAMKGLSNNSENHNTTEGNVITFIVRDLFLNIFPDNIVGVATFQASTNFSEYALVEGEKLYPQMTVYGCNMIGVLFCSLAFGLATNYAGDNGIALQSFFKSLGDVTTILMQKFLLVTPIGVFFMVMSSVAGLTDIIGTFKSLGFYVLANVAGQLVHFICLLLTFLVICRNPFKLLAVSGPAYFIAFATTSAIVSLPKCFEACDKLRYPKRTSRFVLPLVGALKSDASAIFIVISCVFVAHLEGIQLDYGKITIIVFLATAYVSALPNVPSAGLIAVMTILSSIGIPIQQTSLLFAMEWLHDRIRAGNSALSHLFGTGFTHYVCNKDELEESEEEDLNISV